MISRPSYRKSGVEILDLRLAASYLPSRVDITTVL